MLNTPVNYDVSADMFADALRRASTEQLSVGELIECAEKLKALGQSQRTVEVYKAWVAFNPDHPLLYAMYFNYGMALSENVDPAGAINALRESIRLKPDFYRSYINLGRILEDQGNAGRAVGQWLSLTNSLPMVNGDAVVHKTTALKQIGRVLETNMRDGQAEDALRQCLEIYPDQPEVVQHWIALRQRQCKWPLLVETEFVRKSRLIAGISPLSLANFADDPMFQLATAHHYNKQSIGMPARPPRRHVPPAQPRTGRLKIGYVSSDLREHAVGFSMTDVIETHNRKDFEIFTYYCGIKRPDATQARIKESADHWCEINGMDDEQAAMRIREDEIDILVDLNGYTKDARTKVFALRPAPINVNWFGFPGTMGSPYHHYIIADDFIIPPGMEIYYSEQVLRLPCYQPNDRKRVVSTAKLTRADAQLPENAFVYCCLNGMQKLTARTFERWMTILRNVDNSVLWLLAGTPETNAHVRSQAQAHGIAPERLIFAEKKLNPDHVARYQLADLFLDNLPYGAHTTAADSMWMGVPILTLPGRTFASRVCGSLLKAAGIGEMICSSADEYVARAVAFGRDRSQLAPIKQKLIAGRQTCLLFDTPKLMENLEGLYRQMWADFAAGKLPQPNLRNLETYHEVALDFDHANIELLSDEAYRALYLEKLATRNEFYPMQDDARLWQGAA